MKAQAVSGRWSAGKLIIAACLAMLAVEAWIFLCQSDDWDLQDYQVYTEHCRETSWKSLYDDYTVEYPPLGVLFMVATDAVAQRLPDCSRLGRFFDTYDCPQPFANFKFLYRLEMAAVVFLGFLLINHFLKSRMPDAPDLERCERLAVFCIGTALLAQIAFDRLDAMLGALLLAALGLMCGRKHYFWSFAVLAVAIDFKFVPVVLGPLWALGALPVGMIAGSKADDDWRRLVTAVTARGVLLAALAALLCAPFLLAAGGRCLAFVAYHKARGIEFESTYAALLGFLKYSAGIKTFAQLRFGSYDIQSSLSPALVRAAPIVAGGLLVAVTCLLIANASRAAKTLQRNDAPDKERLARAWPGGFVAHTLLVLLIFVFANKVFSPQYLLWLLPLAPLVPLSRWPRRLFHAGFLGVCLVTSLIYPYCVDDTLGKVLSKDMGTFTGPSPFGVLLLTVRAALMAALIAGLVVHLLRRERDRA